MFIHTKKSIKLISLYVMSSTHFTENSDDFQQPEFKFKTMKEKILNEKGRVEGYVLDTSVKYWKQE